MNEKDEKIEYALKAQADEGLPDADRILMKARAEMRNKKPNTDKTKNLAVVFASLAACAAMVCVIALGAAGIGTLLSGGNMDSAIPSVPSDAIDSSQATYAASELRGREVGYAVAYEAFSRAADEQAEFPLSRLEESVSVKYYLFEKSLSGETVLLKCDARIYDPVCGYDDLTLYFELSNRTFDGNAEYLNLSYGYLNTYESGEYVSRAYLTDGYRCMLCVMNAYEFRLDHYMGALFGAGGGEEIE